MCFSRLRALTTETRRARRNEVIGEWKIVNVLWEMKPKK